MAKDPAFLFYPNDWIGGTMGMTFEEKGAYIEVLMMQFNRGHMTTHMIGQTVGQLWVNIKDKFEVDENGLYYNKRLEEEQNKRKSFTQSRRNNIKGENQYTKNPKKEGHKNGHMTSHMENENENVIDTIKLSEISFEEIRPFIDIKIMRKSLKPEHSLTIWNEFIQREQDTKFDDITHVRRMLEGYITKTDWSYLTKSSNSDWLYASGPSGPYKYQTIEGKNVNTTPVSREEYLNSKK